MSAISRKEKVIALLDRCEYQRKTIARLTYENQMLNEEIKDARAYADKLAAGLPEGMLPKDVETLREANAKLAQVVHELREAAKWVSECWGKSDQEWYRPDMDDAMEKLNELLPKGTDDGKIN